MAYQMSDDLLTGNNLIDSEHKQLFDAINNLLEACAKGEGRVQITKTTKFLYDYTSKHFADEERLQIQSRYPEYQNHKQMHESFKKSVQEVSKKLEEQGPTVALVGEINSLVSGWLINHIKREDKKLATYLKTK